MAETIDEESGEIIEDLETAFDFPVIVLFGSYAFAKDVSCCAFSWT